jgi:myo-inositol-1(or 4)-monophosphatase
MNELIKPVPENVIKGWKVTSQETPASQPAAVQSSYLELKHEGMGVKVKYGIGPEGYDRIVIREKNGGGSVIIPYLYINGELYVGANRAGRSATGGLVTEVPRGFSLPKESHEETAKREFQEETGVKESLANRIHDLGGKPVNPNSTYFVANARQREGVKLFGLEVHPDEVEVRRDSADPKRRIYKFTPELQGEIKEKNEKIKAEGIRFVHVDLLRNTNDGFTHMAMARLLTTPNIPHHEIPFTGEIITPELVSTVRMAGKLALEVQQAGLQATVKSTKEDLVTQGDTRVTEELKSHISRLFPGCVYLDEETQETHAIDVTKENMVVIIDPIDGTGNYYQASLEPEETKRNPNWGISIGFVKNGELVAGIIEQPQTGTTYYAEKGTGAYKNGKRMYVSVTHSPNNARLIYSPPYPKDKEAFAASSGALARMKQEIPMQLSRLNSQVIETMQVAEGRQDAFIHLKTKPWDIAAASVIVPEAGGRVMDVKGNKYTPFGETILLTNGNLDVTPITRIALEELDSVRKRKEM